MLTEPGNHPDHSGEHAREVKAHLFGDDASDALRKRLAKARFLKALEESEDDVSAGTETRDQRDVVTQPKRGGAIADPIRVGRFAVLRKLGQGGMGVVYAAYDEDLDRKVALKLIRGDLIRDERGHLRMQREAQALARLSHPNVVQVHEIGRWEEHDFVAMEFVAGHTLDHWLEQRPRSWSEVLAVMVDAGRGLEAAHAAGLVHRDFKPSNLIIGEDGRARVLDFGLARASSDSESDVGMPVADMFETGVGAAAGGTATLAPEHDSLDVDVDNDSREETQLGSGVFDRELTATGACLGTPAYMAPEQHLGERATAASDQFSFCLVLYEALFGERPYRASNRDEYATRVTEGEFVIPSAKTGVPVWLRDAVCRGLRPLPGERWPSMAALLAELTRDRRRRWLRLATAASLVGMFGIGLSLSSGQQGVMCEFDRDTATDWDASARARVREAFESSQHEQAGERLAQVERRLDTYVDELVAARTAACEAHWVERAQSDEQLALRNGCLDQRQQQLRAAIEVLADADASVVDRAPHILARVGDVGLCARVDLLELGVPAPKDEATVATIADIREDIARAHAAREAGHIDAARVFADDVRERAAEVDYPPLRAESAYLDGANAFVRLDHGDAKAMLLEAVRASGDSGNLELQAQVTILAARLELALGHQPDFLIANVEASVSRLGGPPDLQVELKYLHALVLRSHDAPRALELFDEAVELASREFMGNEHLLARVLLVRAAHRSSMGQQQGARDDLERALALGLDRDDVNGLNSVFDLGVVELEDQRYEQAEPLLLRALEGYERVYGSKHAYVAHSHLALSQLALARKDFEQAERHLERALEILPETHPDHGFALDAAAGLHLTTGREEAAVADLSRAVELAEIAGERGSLAYLRGRLGRALVEAGRYQDALEPLQESITSYEHDSPSVEIIDPLRDRARALRALGQPREALESLERALELMEATSGRPATAAQVQIELALTHEQLGAHDRSRELAEAAAHHLEPIPEQQFLLERVEHLLSPATLRALQVQDRSAP